MVKEAKLTEKAGDYAKAAEIYGECKNISSELFKLGITEEAENLKVFANLESEALANIKEFTLTNSCINGNDVNEQNVSFSK